MLRNYAMITGLILLCIGLIGFIAPLTPTGHIFGVLTVSTGRNLLYMSTGVMGIWAATSSISLAPGFFAWLLFIAYGFIALTGFITGGDNGIMWGIVHTTRADNILHLLVSLSALAMIMVEQRRLIFR